MIQIIFSKEQKVETSWGDTLTAHEGDYIVYADKEGKPDQTDRWVVNGPVFEATYKMAPYEKMYIMSLIFPENVKIDKSNQFTIDEYDKILVGADTLSVAKDRAVEYFLKEGLIVDKKNICGEEIDAKEENVPPQQVLGTGLRGRL